MNGFQAPPPPARAPPLPSLECGAPSEGSARATVSLSSFPFQGWKVNGCGRVNLRFSGATSSGWRSGDLLLTRNPVVTSPARFFQRYYLRFAMAKCPRLRPISRWSGCGTRKNRALTFLTFFFLRYHTEVP